MAEPTVFLQLPVQRFFTSTGEPLAFGKVYSYTSGTSTPKAMYADLGATTPLPNPVILGADGRLTAYLVNDEFYRIDVFDANDVHQPGWPVDTVGGIGIGGGGYVPVLRGATTTGVGSYTAQTGVYVRHGPLVFFTLVLSFVAHTGSGNAQIIGFPFDAQFGLPMASMIWGNGLTLVGPIIALFRDGAPRQIELFCQNIATGNIDPLTIAELLTAPEVFMSIGGVYYTDD